MASAQGIDVSSFQAPLTVSGASSYDFVFTKATEGTGITDSNFSGNWAAIKAAGKPRGAYHELTPASAAPQAALFMKTVTSHGLASGDMLAVVLSDYVVTGAAALTFVQAVEAACMANGTANPILIYSDLNDLPKFGAVSGYPLWIAAYRSTAPASVAPFPGWKFWQYNDVSVDKDAYNGTAADLASWLSTYTTDPKGDEMTPSVAYWVDPATGNTLLYHAVRGSDGIVYYMGPDTNYAWQAVDANSHCESGVDIIVTPAGATYICYVNTAGNIAQYYRAPGAAGGWQWQNLGGNVN